MTASAASTRPLMAIQVGAISFADEGVPQVLDVLQERAGVNAIFFAAYGWHKSAFAAGDPEDTYCYQVKALGLDEAPFEVLPAAGRSAEYVEQETRRCVDGVGDGLPVYPGIDVDIPSGDCPTTAHRVRAAVVGAVRGGASAVILSRKYSEMRLDNLAGARAALRELGYS